MRHERLRGIDMVREAGVADDDAALRLAYEITRLYAAELAAELSPIPRRC